MLWQPSLPSKYQTMSPSALCEQIQQRKDELGDQLVILGHHYQSDEVIDHADFTGDSFKLSQLAAQKVQEVGASYVIFCGVHFMAESADVLTPESVSVILPDLSAGCSMADMAQIDDVQDAWDELTELLESASFNGRIVPMTYMNSSAAIKAFVAEKGGAVCTSSNAEKMVQWAFNGGSQPITADEQIKVIFLPDQHLGRNTSATLGCDVAEDTCVWDPKALGGLGGQTPERLLTAKVILWKGHCSVHKLFRPEHVDMIKAHEPETTVIVHPECDHQVVLKADQNGSTEAIIRAVNEAPSGSSWAIGTEVHMVNRLAKQHPDKKIRMLSECQCLCTTMYRIDPAHLLWVLDELVAGRVVNQITVDQRTRESSCLALQRMLDVTQGTTTTTPV